MVVRGRKGGSVREGREGRRCRCGERGMEV